MQTPSTNEAATTLSTVLDTATQRLAEVGVDNPRFDAELLLAESCSLDRSAMHVRLTSPITPADHRRFEALLEKRAQGVPLQYLRGHQEFWSLDFEITPDVLIPRPETELLIEQALELGGIESLCDIGTGSGCIAITLADALPGVAVTASDISPAAVAVARRNAERVSVSDRIRFACGNLFDEVVGQRFTLIASNPPYVESTAIDGGQRELSYEPRLALDGGADGLDVIRRLVAATPSYLVAGGWLLMEIGCDQEPAVLALAHDAGCRDATVVKDYAGLPRLLRARW